MDCTTKQKQRVKWIDVAKGAGIVLVALGHLTNGQGESIWLPGLAGFHVALYLFHMPLFFLLGGLVLHVCTKSFHGFVLSRARSLVVPYYVFSLYYLAKPGFLVLFPSLASQFGSEASESLVAVAWEVLIMGRGLWFLWAYFWGELCAFILLRALLRLCVSEHVQTAACAGAGALLVICEQLWWSVGPAIALPFQLISGLEAAGYILVGVALRDVLSTISRNAALVGCFGVISLFCVCAMEQVPLAFVSPEVVSVSTFGVPLLDAAAALLIALVGSLGAILFSQALRACPVLEFVGRDSIVFYALSAPAMNLSKALLFIGVGIDVSSAPIALQLACGLFLTLGSLLVIWPFDLFIHHLLPWTIGQRQIPRKNA